MTGDSKERYGSVSRIFHWGMAVLILWQVMKFFDRLAEGEHWVGQTLVPWHVSIGSLLLLLVIFRIIWAGTQRHHRPVQDPSTVTMVRLGHFLLYAAMVLMPITGMMILVGNGYGWAPFGIQLIAEGPEIAWMANVGGTLHSPIAWILLVMIIGHVGIALLHHFVKKDGVLRRMI